MVVEVISFSVGVDVSRSGLFLGFVILSFEIFFGIRLVRVGFFVF